MLLSRNQGRAILAGLRALQRLQQYDEPQAAMCYAKDFQAIEGGEQTLTNEEIDALVLSVTQRINFEPTDEPWTIDPHENEHVIKDENALRVATVHSGIEDATLITKAPRMLWLLTQAYEYKREQFDGPPNVDLNVSGGDMIDWFTQWRESVREVMAQIEAASDGPVLLPAENINAANGVVPPDDAPYAAVVCPVHGVRELSFKRYMDELFDADKKWACPSCGLEAEYHEVLSDELQRKAHASVAAA